METIKKDVEEFLIMKDILDHFISADPKELKDRVTGIREIEKIKGNFPQK